MLPNFLNSYRYAAAAALAKARTDPDDQSPSTSTSSPSTYAAALRERLTNATAVRRRLERERIPAAAAAAAPRARLATVAAEFAAKEARRRQGDERARRFMSALLEQSARHAVVRASLAHQAATHERGRAAVAAAGGRVGYHFSGTALFTTLFCSQNTVQSMTASSSSLWST